MAGMCWSPEVSASLGVAGLATAAYAAAKRTSTDLTVPLAFFSLMEFIQFFGYAHIDQCGDPLNRWATILSYAHIAIQPVFFNMLYMYALPRALSASVRRAAYAASIVMSAVLFAKIVPFASATACSAGETLCGAAWCSVSGSWHLAWQVPWYHLPLLPGDILLYYLFAVMVIPLFFGAWRGVLFALIGPLLAFATTQDPNEWPAVWCLFSVPLILANVAVMYLRNRVPPGRP